MTEQIKHTTATNEHKAFKLPKMYRRVTLHFWSLRMALGDNLGIIFDNDETVARVVMRVLVDNGWKWSICDWGSFYDEVDQDILDEIGMDVENIMELKNV